VVAPRGMGECGPPATQVDHRPLGIAPDMPMPQCAPALRDGMLRGVRCALRGVRCATLPPPGPAHVCRNPSV